MGSLSKHRSNLPHPLPKALWANEISHEGLFSDKPVKVRLLRDVDPNSFDPDSNRHPWCPLIYVSSHRANNHTLYIACLGQDSFGAGVRFASQKKKDVENWIKGAEACRHLLKQLLATHNYPISDCKKYADWRGKRRNEQNHRRHGRSG